MSWLVRIITYLLLKSIHYVEQTLCYFKFGFAARASGNEEQLWTLLQTVEEYLLRIVNTVHSSIRHEIVTAILDKFYTFISDPRKLLYFFVECFDDFFLINNVSF